MNPCAKRQDAVAREHRRRFRIDGPKASIRLASALKVLEENDEAIRIALERVCTGRPVVTPEEMRAALRMLVEGPNGELR